MKNDIYDADVFDLESFHMLEHNEKNDPFRWTEGLFKIVPKQEIKNVFIKFVCEGSDKKIIIFVENEYKNIKHEYNLQNGSEYILIISVIKDDKVTFFVTPNVKTTNGDPRNLGLLVKKVYYDSQEYKTSELIISTNPNYKMYDSNTEYLSKDFSSTKNNFSEISIFTQHKDVSFIDLKYSKKNFEFNSCIFVFNNKKYLMTRQSMFINKKATVNNLKLYEYDTLKPIPLDIKDEIDFEQYEDPRVLVHDNKIYVSCVTYSHEKIHLIHQKMLVFNEKFEHIDNIHFEYGFNGKNRDKNSGKEKNWTFFVQDGRLMCVYKMSPHTVVEFSWTGEVISEYVSHVDIQSKWQFGLCRGGTNPIYKDGFYHAFFHSSIYWKNGKNRYVMGYYKFNPTPPYTIVGLSTDPILWGNSVDEFIYPEANPPVVFPCGAILENKNFIVSFGFNDEKTGIIKI
jgi:predicted GH43/DUF377 family glycosyl hydrolase